MKATFYTLIRNFNFLALSVIVIDKQTIKKKKKKSFLHFPLKYKCKECGVWCIWLTTMPLSWFWAAMDMELSKGHAYMNFNKSSSNNLIRTTMRLTKSFLLLSLPGTMLQRVKCTQPMQTIDAKTRISRNKN